jgi:hypothetical protein
MNLTDEVLKAIEFSVESRMNLEGDEQCTIIASPEIIHAIRLGIAKGQIFGSIYSRLILQENSNAVDPYQMTIVPDSVIESAIQDQIREHLESNEDTKAKMKVLNDMMANLDEETLMKISLEDESTLTEEELQLKADIQSKMIEVGMKVDLMFSDKGKAKATADAVDKIFDKVADNNSTISLKGLIKDEKEA